MIQDHKAVEEREAKKAAEALYRLMSNEDFQFFVEHVLVKELLTQRDLNEELQGEELIRGQGEARGIRKILKKIDGSPQLYVRLRAREGQRVSSMVGLG